MVDVSDLPYRLLCRRAGAAVAYTEMLNIGAILHENRKTLNMLKTNNLDRPVGLQITGKSVEEFEKVVPHAKNFDLVDINCGCPSLRITDNASGSYLLRNPKKISEMIWVLKNAGFVTTAKIRLGFKKNNVVAVARAVEKAGADALTVHARMAYHGNSVPADWKWIAKVKKTIGIPVIGNGDIDSGKKAEEMLEVADGVMVARAAIGNPLIFRNILYYLKTGKEKVTTKEERIASFLEYLSLAKKYDVVEIPRIKYLSGHFLSSFEGAAKLRAEFMSLKTFDEMNEFVKAV